MCSKLPTLDAQSALHGSNERRAFQPAEAWGALSAHKHGIHGIHDMSNLTGKM